MHIDWGAAGLGSGLMNVRVSTPCRQMCPPPCPPGRPCFDSPGTHIRHIHHREPQQGINTTLLQSERLFKTGVANWSTNEHRQHPVIAARQWTNTLLGFLLDGPARDEHITFLTNFGAVRSSVSISLILSYSLPVAATPSWRRARDASVSKHSSSSPKTTVPGPASMG